MSVVSIPLSQRCVARDLVASTSMRSAGFEVTAVTVGPQLSWLCAVGKLVDADAATRLADLLEQQFAAGQRFTRLDLAQVPMIDRLGLDVLVGAHHRCLAAGGVLVLTGVGPRIARLLELTGLDRTLFTTATTTAPGGLQHSMTWDGRPAEQSQLLADPVGLDQAVGVVMGRGHCSVAQATERLVRLARATNRTLDEVARSILDESAGTRQRRQPLQAARVVDLARDRRGAAAGDGEEFAPTAERTQRPERFL